MEVLKMTGNGLTMVHAMKSSPSSGSILSMGGISKNVCLKKGSFGKGGTARSRMAPSSYQRQHTGCPHVDGKGAWEGVGVDEGRW